MTGRAAMSPSVPRARWSCHTVRNEIEPVISRSNWGIVDQIDSNRAGRAVSAVNALAVDSERLAYAEIDIGIILELSEKIASLTIEGVKAAFHEPVIVQLVTCAAANIAIALIWRPKIE